MQFTYFLTFGGNLLKLPIEGLMTSHEGRISGGKVPANGSAHFSLAARLPDWSFHDQAGLQPHQRPIFQLADRLACKAKLCHES